MANMSASMLSVLCIGCVLLGADSFVATLGLPALGIQRSARQHGACYRYHTRCGTDRDSSFGRCCRLELE